MKVQELTQEGLDELVSAKEIAETKVGELTSQLGERDAKLGEINGTLTEKDTRITELEQTLSTTVAEKETLASSHAETQRAITDLTDSYTQAVSAYKTALVQANPSVPVELITGDTTEAIDQSLASAKTLVAQVRTTLEAELAAGKVPAGAPARTPPDLSALSPREKLQYAIGGSK